MTPSADDEITDPFAGIPLFLRLLGLGVGWIYAIFWRPDR